MSVTEQLKQQVKTTNALEAELQKVRDELLDARKAMAEGRGMPRLDRTRRHASDETRGGSLINWTRL